ncbi:hypothetical protein NDU88_005956 [Pleurodeles waltl]|uniref:Uncharacterized protein n=1 Tax=Pleurodeles waltl TaxID=8319 RepID=A0AAV7SN88_PLEWA|nr:hypothetical protein NDU88_005956 [Pleurodeles waltl]
MDARVIRAMELLKEAGRLDLLAAPAAPRYRPVRRAACFPPKERKQVAWGPEQDLDIGEEGCLEQIEGVGGDGLEPVREISHILEWSDDSSQGGGEDRVQEGEGEVLTFRVLPPVRTYGVFGGGEVAGADGDQEVVTGCRSRSQGGAVSSRSDIDMDFFQGAQCRSEDGDPGELLAGSEPWEEEEVLAGPSAASWTGCRRDGAREGVWLYCRLEQVQVQAETENGHMTDVNGWEEKKTRQMMIDKGGQ